MTDPSDRRAVAPATDEIVLPVGPTPEAVAEPARCRVPARIALAMLCAAAGVVHLVMVPTHSQLSTSEGIAFSVAGWLQIGLAVLLAIRPDRPVLLATIGITTVYIGAWVVSRVWGLPYGSHAWEAESASFVDLTVVGLEAALVLLAGLLLWRPDAGATWSEPAYVVASVAPLAVIALVTAALMAPSTADHAHAGGDEQVATGAPHDHAHGDATDEDNGFSLLGNGHQHERGEVELDERTRAALNRELAATGALAARYPTLADALAAGYTEAGPFSPGLGLHLMPPVDKMAFGSDGRYDTQPELESPFLIYDGIHPEAPIAGFMYFAFGAATEPEGFSGPNDHWHYHTDVCVVMADGNVEVPLGADRSATQEQCDRFGGRLIENTGYMVHVWSVPGYENPDGMFAELTPLIDCPDGTYYTIGDQEIGFSRTTCRT